MVIAFESKVYSR